MSSSAKSKLSSQPSGGKLEEILVRQSEAQYIARCARLVLHAVFQDLKFASSNPPVKKCLDAAMREKSKYVVLLGGKPVHSEDLNSVKLWFRGISKQHVQLAVNHSEKELSAAKPLRCGCTSTADVCPRLVYPLADRTRILLEATAEINGKVTQGKLLQVRDALAWSLAPKDYDRRTTTHTCLSVQKALLNAHTIPKKEADVICKALTNADAALFREVQEKAVPSEFVTSDEFQGRIREAVELLLRYANGRSHRHRTSLAELRKGPLNSVVTVAPVASAVQSRAADLECGEPLPAAVEPPTMGSVINNMFERMKSINASPQESRQSGWAQLTAESCTSMTQSAPANGGADATVVHSAARTVWGEGASAHQFQVQVLDALMRKQDVVLSTPTGSGKTGTIALAAACLRGVHVVVAPLIALQHSICEDLWKCGIMCAPTFTAAHGDFAQSCTSSLEKGALPTKQQALKDCSAHGIDTRPFRPKTHTVLADTFVLVTSPEQALNKQASHLALKAAGDKLRSVTIDEVHLYQQWQTFRADMGDMAKYKAAHQAVPFLLLSASLHSAAVQPLNEAFGLQTPRVIHCPDKGPPKCVTALDVGNIFLEQLQSDVEGLRKNHAEYSYIPKQLVDLDLEQSSVLVFVQKRRDCTLAKNAINSMMGSNKATLFHGEEDVVARAKMGRDLADWLAGKIPIMVSTTAMANGVHNSRCARVIVHHVPADTTTLLQMIGRARSCCASTAAVVRVCNTHLSKTLKLVHEVGHPEEAVPMTCLHKALECIADRRDNIWPVLQWHFDRAVPISRGTPSRYGDSRLLDVQPLLSAVCEYVNSLDGALSANRLQAALWHGVLPRASHARGGWTEASRQAHGALSAALVWLDDSLCGIPNDEFDAFIFLGWELGYFDMQVAKDRQHSLVASTRPTVEGPAFMWTTWCDKVELPTLSASFTSTAAATPVADSTDPSGEAEQQQPSAETYRHGKLSSAGDAVNAVALEQGCLFRQDGVHTDAENQSLVVKYRCDCKLPLRRRRLEGQDQACGVHASVHINCKTGMFFMRVCGTHAHPACLRPGAGHFPGRNGPKVEEQYTWYQGLPLHPEVDVHLRKVFHQVGHSSPLAITRELPAVMKDVQQCVTVHSDKAPKHIEADTFLDKALAESNLGKRHGLHRTQPTPGYVLNFMFRQKQAQRGKLSMWQALKQFVADSQADAATSGSSSIFDLHDCLGKAGTSNDGYLFIQTDAMRALTRDEAYAGALHVAVYEDDTGGLIKYKSKFFVWMVRSPHTHRGIPVAYMMYVSGNDAADGEATDPKFRSDGLVRALVWSYRAIERNSGNTVKLTAKMMDKCTHGHAAWAIFQAGKLRPAILGLADVLQSSDSDAPPETLSKLGKALKLLQGIPELADCRDPGSVPSKDITSARWDVYEAAQAAAFMVASSKKLANVISQPACSPELRAACSHLRETCRAKVFLCIFHAHKACCENMLTRVGSSAVKTQMGESLSAFFRARDQDHANSLLQEFKQLFDGKYPAASAYLEKNWATRTAMLKWGRWHRTDHLNIDVTTNLVESHWNLIKHRVLHRRINVDVIELIRELVGVDGSSEMSLFSQILRTETALFAGSDAVKSSVTAMQKTRAAAQRITQLGEIRHIAGQVYAVRSKAGAGEEYNVNARSLVCACPQAGKGTLCKHAVAVQMFQAERFDAEDGTGHHSTSQTAGRPSTGKSVGTPPAATGGRGPGLQPVKSHRSTQVAPRPVDILDRLHVTGRSLVALTAAPALTAAQRSKLLKALATMQDVLGLPSSTMEPQVDQVAAQSETYEELVAQTAPTTHVGQVHRRVRRGTKRAAEPRLPDRIVHRQQKAEAAASSPQKKPRLDTGPAPHDYAARNARAVNPSLSAYSDRRKANMRGEKSAAKGNKRRAGPPATAKERAEFGAGSVVHAKLSQHFPDQTGAEYVSAYGIVVPSLEDCTVSVNWVSAAGHEMLLSERELSRLHAVNLTKKRGTKVQLSTQGRHLPDEVFKLCAQAKAMSNPPSTKRPRASTATELTSAS